MKIKFEQENDEKIKMPMSVFETNYKIIDYNGKLIKIKHRKETYDCVEIPMQSYARPYKVNVKKLMLEKVLSLKSRGSLMNLCCSVDADHNTVVLDNGEPPTPKQLMDLMELKTNKFYEIIKELQDLEVIIIDKIMDRYVVYLNPFLYRCQDFISKKTYEKFKDSKYNNFKVKNQEYAIKNDSKKSFRGKGIISYADDGTKCLSKFEVKIHNYLITLPISNIQKEIMYKKFISNPDLHDMCGTKRCDWLFDYNGTTYIVEYFGLINQGNYNERHDLKLKIIDLDGKSDCFIPIYQKDLNKLDNIFFKFK